MTYAVGFGEVLGEVLVGGRAWGRWFGAGFPRALVGVSSIRLIPGEGVRKSLSLEKSEVL